MHIHVTRDSLKPSFSVRPSSRFAYAGVQCIAKAKMFSKVFPKLFYSCLQNIYSNVSVKLRYMCLIVKDDSAESFYFFSTLGRKFSCLLVIPFLAEFDIWIPNFNINNGNLKFWIILVWVIISFRWQDDFEYSTIVFPRLAPVSVFHLYFGDLN